MKFHYSTSNKIVQSLQTHIQLFIFSCLIRSGQTVEMGPLIPKWSNRCFGFPAFVTNLYAMSVQGRAAGTNLLWKIIFIYSTRSKLFQEEVWKQFEVEQKCICDYLEQRLTIKQTKQSWQLQLLIPPKLKHKTMWFIMSWKKEILKLELNMQILIICFFETLYACRGQGRHAVSLSAEGGNELQVRCWGSKSLSGCQQVLVEDFYGG